MNSLPLFFNLADRPVLIVGGGDIALRKADLLERAGAKITFVALQFHADILQRFSNTSRHQLKQHAYNASCLDGQSLVIATTNDHQVNQQVFFDAESRNIPVNVVDNPDLCRFIFPAIIDRNPITVAVSSSGKSPVLARLLRAKLESVIPKQYGELAELAGKFREKVKHTLPHLTARRQFWEQALTGNVAESVFANNPEKAEAQLQDLLQHYQENIDKNPEKLGKVYIVGAGAGDPELLTFKALRLMQQADIIFYDNLVSASILDLCRRDASKVYVGKKRSNHAVQQQNINQLLVEHTKQGKRVLRLKGGDPFIFGRGGEEAEYLVQAGVDYEIVAGITSATAAASCAGIPLTHRDYAQSVKFVTGCLKTNTINENYQDLLDDSQTVVFYMGLNALPTLTQGLISAGKSADTPIAIVSNASLPNQQVLTGTLNDIVAKQEQAKLPAPALLIMGNVVKLHQKLAWFAK